MTTSKRMTNRLDGFGMPITEEVLLEMARVGDSGPYSFWVYTEKLLNPSFHMKHKADFEIVLQMKDLKILEIKHNESKFTFEKNQLPPREILDVVNDFLSQNNKKDSERTNRQALSFAWKLLNE